MKIGEMKERCMAERGDEWEGKRKGERKGKERVVKAANCIAWQ
jgi:hypothetical protein